MSDLAAGLCRRGKLPPLQRRSLAGSMQHTAEVGVTLHEMIAGIRPFDRSSPAATMSAVLHDDAPALPATTPVALTRTIERLLEKAPGIASGRHSIWVSLWRR